MKKPIDMSIDELWQERAELFVYLDGKPREQEPDTWARFDELKKEVELRVTNGQLPGIFGRIRKTMEKWKNI